MELSAGTGRHARGGSGSPGRFCRLSALLVAFLAGASFPAAGQDADAPPRLHGRVIEAETGRPLEGRIAVDQLGRLGDRRMMVLRHVPLSAGGEFVVDELEPGPAQVTALVRNHGSSTVFLWIAAADAPRYLEFVLPRAGAIRGTVVDPEGRPVADVTARVRYEPGIRPLETGRAEVLDRAAAEGIPFRALRRSGERESGPTRGLGEFTIMDIDPERPFRLTLEHPDGRRTETGPMELAPGQVVDGMEIVLGPGAARQLAGRRAPRAGSPSAWRPSMPPRR